MITLKNTLPAAITERLDDAADWERYGGPRADAMQSALTEFMRAYGIPASETEAALGYLVTVLCDRMGLSPQITDPNGADGPDVDEYERIVEFDTVAREGGGELEALAARRYPAGSEFYTETMDYLTVEDPDSEDGYAVSAPEVAAFVRKYAQMAREEGLVFGQDVEVDSLIAELS